MQDDNVPAASSLEAVTTSNGADDDGDVNDGDVDKKQQGSSEVGE